MSAPAITDDDRIAPVRPDNAAYALLFTSGSTGRPKGVTVSHAALSNMHAWFGDVVGERDDRVVIVRRRTPSMPGARTGVAADGGGAGCDDASRRASRSTACSTCWPIIRSPGRFVPSALSVFLEVKTDAGRELPALRTLITGGEALPVPVAETVQRALPGWTSSASTGPTEATVRVTEHVLRPGDATVPIGRTGANTPHCWCWIHVCIRCRRVSGELYTGGVQVARGYAAQPALTAERFIADPFGEPGTAAVPHGRPRPVERRRRVGIPGPHRLPGQAARSAPSNSVRWNRCWPARRRR